MANVDDVLDYLLYRYGPMGPYRAHILLFYAQAWHLAWEDTPLFRSPFQARATGPVAVAIQPYHKGLFTLTDWSRGNRLNLTKAERKHIRRATKDYTRLEYFLLAELVRSEPPYWQARQREGLRFPQQGQATIHRRHIKKFYRSLYENPNLLSVAETNFS